LFTLTSPTTVFAGFNQTTSGVNFVDPDGPTGTDHNGAALALTVGTTFGGLSNNDLTRNYAFAINVQQTPEPASLVLWGLMGVGVVFTFWRRKARKS
jgi:hypothetical protein